MLTNTTSDEDANRVAEEATANPPTTGTQKGSNADPLNPSTSSADVDRKARVDSESHATETELAPGPSRQSTPSNLGGVQSHLSSPQSSTAASPIIEKSTVKKLPQTGKKRTKKSTAKGTSKLPKIGRATHETFQEDYKPHPKKKQHQSSEPRDPVGTPATGNSGATESAHPSDPRAFASQDEANIAAVTASPNIDSSKKDDFAASGVENKADVAMDLDAAANQGQSPKFGEQERAMPTGDRSSAVSNKPSTSVEMDVDSGSKSDLSQVVSDSITLLDLIQSTLSISFALMAAWALVKSFHCDVS